QTLLTSPSFRRQLMDLLAVTSQVPWPLDRGGHLRTYHLLRRLAGSFRVRLVAADTEPRGDAVEALRSVGIELRVARVSPRTAWGEATRALGAFARREPYAFYGRHNRPEMWTTIAHELRRRRPDVLYLDHLDS